MKVLRAAIRWRCFSEVPEIALPTRFRGEARRSERKFSGSRHFILKDSAEILIPRRTILNSSTAIWQSRRFSTESVHATAATLRFSKHTARADTRCATALPASRGSISRLLGRYSFLQKGAIPKGRLRMSTRRQRRIIVCAISFWQKRRNALGSLRRRFNAFRFGKRFLKT